jgi:acyl transferase domain-containing protein
MSTALNDRSPLSPLKRALLAVKEMRARLDEVERSATEPIAVIGIGCRFPGGANDPESYWRLLRAGVDAVCEVPSSRWDADEYYDPDPDKPGKMNTRWGGFLRDGIDGFDAHFFGITPREAASMDPQQRLLLEVAWEALEDAGQSPAYLCGSATGVFTGISTNDYSRLFDGAERIDSYMSTGNAFSVAAGRISYVLGLQGPSLAVDTACSSSLVAVHLAVQSLRSGESRMALAGGVNLMLSPLSTLALSHLRMMAPDGRCKTFDEAADGFVRGEGCGIVVLKRLRDALADGDRILALIRGTAVNQDGRSGGLTAPNGPAQEAVIRRALANAGVSPGGVDYVEAHGTGTPLGDPIECKALGAVLNEGRDPGRALLLGSVKTNLGHLEAAAGVASLIKVVLALSHGEIPPHLHLNRLNPHITFGGLSVYIPREPVPWLAHRGPRVGGLSSFGFSGTNAHLVLEEAPAVAGAVARQPAPHLLCLSARTQSALEALVTRFQGHLADHPEQDFAEVCATANAGRAHFEHRVAILAADAAEAQIRLQKRDWIAGTTAEGECPKLGFAFFDGPAIAGVISEAREWTRWNVKPTAVLGDGAGEYAAGFAAGIFSADDALRLATGETGAPPQSPQVPFLSSRGGRRVEVSELARGAYWRAPMLPGARLSEAMRGLGDERCELFLHFGPRPAAANGVWLSGSHASHRILLETLARLYLAGVPIDWSAFYSGRGHRKTSLPKYPFERRRCWIEGAELSQKLPADWLYDLEWEPHAFATRRLSAPAVIAEKVEPNVARVAASLQLEMYAGFLSETDALSAVYCAQALRTLGYDLSAGLPSDPDELARRLGVLPKYQRLFRRIIEILATSESIGITGTEEHIAALMVRYPACAGELSLFARCGNGLAEVLRGEQNPLQILFPDGSVSSVERIYQDSPFFQAMNALVGYAVAAAISPVAPGSRIRILEIGAGTGGATASILRRLSAEQVDYTFTDVSPLFTAHGARKFAAYSFLHCGLLDIEREPTSQGYAESSFDIVLAANVLHAAADLRQALRHVQRLLSPDGILLLLETTRPQYWADLVFGLTEGWWRFSDADLRPSHPLLSKSRWFDLLAECGFSESAAVPGDNTPEARAAKQVLIVSRAGTSARESARGSCALLPDRTGVAESLIEALAAEGVPSVCYTGEPREIPPAAHMLYLLALDAPAARLLTPSLVESTVLSTCSSALRVAQSIANRSIPARLWLVTRGAQKVLSHDLVLAPAQAPLWGLGRVIALEHPEIWGGLIDLDPTPHPGEGEAILQIVRSGGEEDQFALRSGAVYVPRLTPSRDTITRPPEALFDGHASYLVTGGLGALGLRIARWMVERGARHLTLLGLTGASDSETRAAAVRDLRRLGAAIEVVQADVADAAQIVPVIRRVSNAAVPLKGIIHAAGVSVPQPIRAIDTDTLRSVLRPKVVGSWILHEATKDQELDFFVCFSSAAGIWGTAGGGHYAAANQFLDALTHHRRAVGLPALTLNWARWEGEGMASCSDEVGKFFDQIGLGAMPSSRALDLMGTIMKSGATQRTIAAVDWNIFKPIYTAKRRRPLLDRIQTKAAAESRKRGDSTSLLARLDAAPEKERWGLLLAHIQQEVSNVLGFSPGEQPTLDEGFFQMGMDSLTSVELKTRLEAVLARPLPPTLAFEHSTILSLARHLYHEIFGASPGPESDDIAALDRLSDEEARAEFIAELASLKRELQ